MLQITKRSNEYIVFDSRDFQAHHTHVDNYYIAKVIKGNVEKNRLPKSRSLKLLYSHVRVSSNEKYIRQLQRIIAGLNELKNNRG